MERTRVGSIENNIIYVEPNYINSTEEYDINGLNTYEFAPPLEDYSIFVNLEVETRGRNVQSSKSSNNRKLILSFISNTDGTSAVNFMQGTKIPIGEKGATINSLTTNYTDIFLGDLKKNGPSTETFGIESIDIAYNSFMVPEVTIDFVDVRGVALFAQKEYYETNKNIDAAIDSNNKQDIANTFFQCFFTFPYPRFTLLVKGFYGQPVSYELTCADFRARFDSRTGNFACTAKFVGYHFSFLNDVMMNGIVAAPYSDYIGASYWEKRGFKLKGNSGGDVNLPKIGWLLNKMKDIEATANKISQSDPTAQEKVVLDDKTVRYQSIEDAYNNFVRIINNLVIDKYKEENLYYKINTNNGVLRAALMLSPSDNNEEFRVHFGDKSGQIKGAYDSFIEKLDEYNKEHPSEALPKPIGLYDNLPKQRIFSQTNDDKKATMLVKENEDIKNDYEELFKLFKIGVDNGNLKAVNPLLEYKNVYYYKDNKFASTLEEYKKKNSEATKDVEERIEKLKDTAISEALGFHPTVENMTKIVMAHFETFARMIFETAKTICNENPSRTIVSLGVSDVRDISDVSNKSKTSNIVVPPFPKVVTEVKRDNSTIREEAWVGDYSGDFREKDLVHGIINGIKEIAKDIQNYESSGNTGSYGGSDTAKSAVMRFPLQPIDMVATSKPYASGGYDPNDVSSLLGLVGLRGICIFGTNNFSDWDENAKTIGMAEAYNFLADHKLSKEMIKKLSNLSGIHAVTMMKGDDSDLIKRPGDGTKPWPWRLKVSEGKDGIIASNGDLDICRVQGGAFSVPYQNLSWAKINNETVNSIEGAKAMWSPDYINSKGFVNLTKSNIFTFDTNVNRFSTIAESQLKDLEGIDYYREKFTDECKYNSDKYEGILNNGEDIIAYIIENASAITPSDGSCMLPTSKNAFSDKSFRGGYEMDDFHKEYPGKGGDGWVDKDGNIVKRKGSDGYKKYLEEFNSRDFTFVEFPGLLPDLKPYVKYADPATSVFGQYLYYKQKSDKSKALLFLASLGYVFDYKEIISDYIVDDSRTMCVIPLPAVMFIGALLWSNTTEGRKERKFYTTDYYKSALNSLLTLRSDVKNRFIKIFEKWVTSGVENDSLLRSFNDMKKGLELHIKSGVDKFFRNIGEQEDKGVFGGKVTWWSEKFSNSYKSLMDFYKGELSDDFFRNYITVDEDVYGETYDFTRGIRLGNRDGGPSTVHACNFALAGCVFSKNSKFFKSNSNTNINVNPGTLQSFFDGFLEKVKEEKVEEKDTDSQISQAKTPDDSNTDIKIGIYRYCKMLYDKWIAGLTDSDFDRSWTMEAFFEDTVDNKKYFHFIDSFYNVADFINLNIGNFCDEIVSCYRNEQYSLLAFLSSVYSHNRFNFNCVQNFVDLGKRENMEKMFDTVPYTEMDYVDRHPNFIVSYAYESSNYLADIDNSEYENDGFMLNQKESSENILPDALKSRNANSNLKYTIPAFGVSYGKMYQSYFKDIDVSMDNPTVTEQSIKAQFAIACQNNEGEQTGDRSKLYTYGQDLYSIYSNNSYTCNVTMMGCAWVQPMMYFVLTNVPMFRGTYFIIKVSHHIEPGNMITKFTGVRMSNVCTRIARENSIRAKNNQSGNGEANGQNVEIEEKMASIDNDCPYKEYPLTGGSAAGGFEEYTNKLKKWEGGYAGNIDGKTCTMKGVTLETFRQYYGANKSCNDLRNISDEQWNHIFKDGFWDKWRADEINNQSIANLLVDWLYNSGPKHGIGKPQEVLGLPQTYKVTDKEINAINSYPNQRELFQKFWDRRKKFFTDIANCPNGEKCKFLKGWLNRLNDFSYSDNVPKISNNSDGHISELANGFLHALNQTAAASSNGVEIGVNSNKSKGDTLWLTNANKSDNFSTVLDMILSAYPNKVSNVNWILPGNGQSQNSVPAAYLVTVKEGSSSVNIKVTSENNPNTEIKGGQRNAPGIHVSKGSDNSGIHQHFCKALVKKYKSPSGELKKDTNHNLDDYDALFNDDKYKLQLCNQAMSDAGVTERGTGGKENESGYIGDWNVGKFVEKLHYYAANHCEIEHSKNKDKGIRDKPGGSCHLCTGAINRALRDSGFGMKYWGDKPWDVYGKMKSGEDFIEIRGANGVSNKIEFSLGTVQKGDICVMWTPDKKTHFHTCAYDGYRWHSDFVQNSCNVYRNSSSCTLEWHLFRHK